MELLYLTLLGLLVIVFIGLVILAILSFLVVYFYTSFTRLLAININTVKIKKALAAFKH